MTTPQIERIPEPTHSFYNKVYRELAMDGHSLLKGDDFKQLLHIYDLDGIISNPNSGRIMDVACGCGHITLELAQQFPDSHVFGIDTDRISLDFAIRTNKRPNLTYTKKNVYNLSSYNNSIDISTCVGSIHHFDDIDTAFKQIFNTLTENGFLYFSDFNRDALHNLHGQYNVGGETIPEGEMIHHLRTTVTDKKFIEIFRNIDQYLDGDKLYNQRIMLTSNSVLASYTLSEIEKALKGAGFSGIRIDIADLYTVQDLKLIGRAGKN